MLHRDDPYYDAMFADRGELTVVATGGPGTNLVGSGGIAESFTVVRELSGDLPAEVSLIGGGVTSYMDVSADGAMTDAPHPLSSSDRERWVAEPVTLKAGYNGGTVDVYSGPLREFGFDDSARHLDLKVIENSDGMRAPVSIQLQGTRVNKLTGKRQRFPTNVMAVHVAALHASGIRVTPPPPPGTAFSVPLVGGALADVGWCVATSSSTGTGEGSDFLKEGKFGPTPGVITPGNEWRIIGFPEARSTGSGIVRKLRAEFWFKTGSGVFAEPVYLQTVRAPGTPDLAHAFVSFIGTAVRGITSINGVTTNGPARTAVAGWNHIELLWDLVGTLELRVNGSSASAPVPPIVAVREANIIATLGSIQQVSMWLGGPGEAFPASNYTPTFVPEADLDVSRLTLETMPVVDGRPAWELCKELAAAELGMVGFGETGRYYFKNRDALNAPTPVVATWGVDLVDTLTGSTTSDSVRTRITATVSRPLCWDADGPDGVGESPAYMHSDPVELPPGLSTIVLAGSGPMLPPGLDVPVVTNYLDVGVNRSGMAVCRDAAGSFLYTGSAVSATLRRTTASSTWNLDVFNATGRTLWSVWPVEWSSPTITEPRYGKSAGTGAIWLFAPTPQSDADVQTSAVDLANPSASPKWADRAYAIPTSPWCQDVEAVLDLAQRLLIELGKPRAEIGDVMVPADLRVQIGDRVLLVDWQGRIPNVLARITRSEVTISREVENGMIGRYSLRSQPFTLYDVGLRWETRELEDLNWFWSGRVLGDVNDNPLAI